jgi:hypothetical protein
MELDRFPRFWPVNLGVGTFYAVHCNDCSNETTALFYETQSKLKKHDEQCERLTKWYRGQLKKLNDLLENNP